MIEGFQGEEHYARHGGTRFSPNAPAEEINQFVRELPEERKETFYELLKELSEAGLITLHNDGVLADGEGEVGGSDEC
ncbi:hypothetical protein [Paludifilum halophilum]|uniref:Uncharacterized protein n=1 Tax=Paludifilum halophilum TaxID=1642702 RepID=A0A235B6M8_9BACL|nr:hypothetical protein [Paludifilum halophilum]OYD07958.1 hypothetical protein CHM34_07490 [Paludifilum halophilum]